MTLFDVTNDLGFFRLEGSHVGSWLDNSDTTTLMILVLLSEIANDVQSWCRPYLNRTVDQGSHWIFELLLQLIEWGARIISFWLSNTWPTLRELGDTDSPLISVHIFYGGMGRKALEHGANALTREGAITSSLLYSSLPNAWGYSDVPFTWVMLIPCVWED